MHGRRDRACACRARPRHGRRQGDADGAAGGEGRHLPRRRRDAARDAHGRRAGRTRISPEGLRRGRQEGEGDEARRRGRAAREAGGDGEGDARRGPEGGEAVGREGLEAGGRRASLFAGRLPALAGGERALSQGDLRQLSWRAISAAVGLRGPAASDRRGAEGREPLLRACHADEGGGGDDPLALRLHAGAEQGRAPAGRRTAAHDQEARRARRRLHGRRHRLRLGAGRHRRRAPRPRHAVGGEGQGAFGFAHRQGDQARRDERG